MNAVIYLVEQPVKLNNHISMPANKQKLHAPAWKHEIHFIELDDCVWMPSAAA